MLCPHVGVIAYNCCTKSQSPLFTGAGVVFTNEWCITYDLEKGIWIWLPHLSLCSVGLAYSVDCCDHFSPLSFLPVISEKPRQLPKQIWLPFLNLLKKDGNFFPRPIFLFCFRVCWHFVCSTLHIYNKLARDKARGVCGHLWPLSR